MDKKRIELAYGNNFTLGFSEMMFAGERKGVRMRPRRATPSVRKKPLPAPPLMTAQYETLDALEAAAKTCTRCALAKARHTVVFGKGSRTPRIVFVGEAPGEQEDLQGFPFVGRAGKLLDKWLTAAGLTLNEVYIMNTLKCRPPENRDPLPEEKAACRPWFDRQLELLRPKFICALGKVGFGNLVPIEEGQSFGQFRQKKFDYKGVPVVATYHPSFLLRSPNMMPKVIEDLRFLLTIVDLPIPETLKHPTLSVE
ncbi:MAG: uracil-DNA glycosylase [Spirochaetota bacterium]